METILYVCTVASIKILAKDNLERSRGSRGKEGTPRAMACVNTVTVQF